MSRLAKLQEFYSQMSRAEKDALYMWIDSRFETDAKQSTRGQKGTEILPVVAAEAAKKSRRASKGL